MTEVEGKSPAPSVVDPQTSPDQNSNSNNTEAETSQFPPQGPSGQPFPPPNFAFYNYPPNQQAPPSDGSNPDPNASPNSNGGGTVPYPPPPPGMMYPYAYPQPPPGYMPVPMSGMPLPGALIKPKRKQVKMACTNCAAACKRCDVARPCERCIKYGLSDTCRDGQRKERKKGFKRGPYNKRKRQEEREAHEWEAAQSNPNGEWTPNGPNGTPFPGPPQQGQFPPPPDGYYPAFYALAPPHSGPGPQLVPVTQSGSPDDNPVESQADGPVDPSANTQNGDNSQQPQGQPSFPPPHGQFVYPPLPHGSYPPFGYPFPGNPQQPPSQQSPPEATSSSTKRKAVVEDDSKDDDPDQEDPPTPPRKKRGRRNSDGEWPGTSKRVSKAKSDNPTPTRRSTRKQLNQQDVGAGDGHNDGNAVTETIIEHNVTSQPVGDPVIRSETP
ncbi:hypothetical protein JB92DRAFT_3054792 [Gautieria morchelliformis]|nr:hypothetical protein JB92DRAFT_3054792 [Gautieria morchelliformis]